MKYYLETYSEYNSNGYEIFEAHAISDYDLELKKKIKHLLLTKYNIPEDIELYVEIQPDELECFNFYSIFRTGKLTEISQEAYEQIKEPLNKSSYNVRFTALEQLLKNNSLRYEQLVKEIINDRK